VPPGARREATWMPGRWSFWMRAAPMWPSPRFMPGHPKASARASQVPRNRGRTTTSLSALSPLMHPGTPLPLKEAQMPSLLQPPCVRGWPRHSSRGRLVILDHLAGDLCEALRQLVETRGCPLRFLPSSSPDLTRTLERRWLP
jgi:hypothetical protein